MVIKTGDLRFYADFYDADDNFISTKKIAKNYMNANQQLAYKKDETVIVFQGGCRYCTDIQAASYFVESGIKYHLIITPHDEENRRMWLTFIFNEVI